MTLLMSVLTWVMRQLVSLLLIIVKVGASQLPPLAVKSGGENVVTLPLISAGDKFLANTGSHVETALILAISKVFRTSVEIKFCS